MQMMIRSSKISAPPPVPPRPSKSIVAEALAKSRKVSPVRALYATQPLSAGDLQTQKKVVASQDGGMAKPVVPVRAAPPPPFIKPKPNGQIAQPQVVKSYSSAMVFNPKLRHAEDPRVIRSVSDVSDEITTCGKSRTIVYQSSNLKTSKMEVNLGRKPSVKELVECTNERNKLNDIGLAASNRTPGSRDNQIQKEILEKGTWEKETPGRERPEKYSAEKRTPEKQLAESNRTPGSTEKEILEKGTWEKETSEKRIPEKQPPEEETRKKQIATPKIQSTEVNSIEMNPIDKVIEVIINDKKISETIVQSSDKTTIIVKNTKPDDDNNNSFESANAAESADPTDLDDATSKKVQFDDKLNHEILIAELQSMKEEQERFLKRQRKAPVEIYDCDNDSVHSSSDATRIQHSDWIEVANNGEEVRLSSCQIYIDNSDESSKSSSFSSCSSRKPPQRAPSMSSLHGLPPLPKSLSGFNLLDNTSGHRVETPRGSYRVPASPGPQTPSRAGSSRGATPPTPGSGSGSGHVVYPPHPRVNGTGEIPRGRKITTLDTQLAVLRREMYGLRQLDLSLLSQLYSLNEAIQDFRQMLQDQEDSALSPNSPSPSPSSGDEGDEFYSPAPLRYKPAPPAPPLRRTSNSSSANSSEYGTV